MVFRRLLGRLIMFCRALFRRYGWLFVLALVVAILSMRAFAELTEEVLANETNQFNEHVLLALHRWATPTLDGWALRITALGSVPAVAVQGGLFSLWLLHRRKLLDAVILWLVLGGAAILTASLKLIFGRARPALWQTLVLAPTPAYPSGHALLSTCLFGFVAVWVIAQAPHRPWRWAIGLFSLTIAALISLSRLYLGVHWPTDVLAGILVGVFWLSVCWAVERWQRVRTHAG
ncbi:MAG: phosphatase PAP2 family protein [Candidatus Sericytochromatia bacterium]|nr:phosphatase PAP2 family protein [Candidatus Sericytochromatia bacterium]